MANDPVKRKCPICGQWIDIKKLQPIVQCEHCGQSSKVKITLEIY